MNDAAQWLAAARAGSREALGRVLEAYRGYLLRLAEHELAPELRAKGGASDLVQDTFLEAHQDFAQFRGSSEAELRGWLRQVLLHNVANFARLYHATGKRRVAREVAPDGGSSAEPGAGFIADTPSPSKEAMAHEQAEALWRAVDRLPEDYRLVLLLRHQEKLPFDEVARRMERSAVAVRQLWSRAVRRIQLEMEGRQ